MSTTSRPIAASPERVWEVLADTARWHEWTDSIRSIRRLDDGPLRAGSRVRIQQPKLPPAEWEVTEVRADGADRRGFVWTAGMPGMRSVAAHWVRAIGPDESIATVSIHSSGLLGFVGDRMLREITGRYLTMEAEGLKARAEGRR
jgi:hypothetical protein